ncbi:MAG TPA: hypothetical protein IGS53_28100 [Leptolyngbyaceae cyanobacterium M33_DOE_097]|nr:hypothetical protein [Leptolyngbyaceae cyanobacterium M33_DOE_097]
MNGLSKYWTLIRIDAAEAGEGYKIQPLTSAQDFVLTKFTELDDSQKTENFTVQSELFYLARTNTTCQEESTRAELCLRCYISHPILQACQKRARLFGTGKGFTYRDLLPFVLNDDGRSQLQTFVPFSIEILNSFSPERQCSLGKWADLRVKRHPELNQFLLEHGLRFCSDWALLNRADPRDFKGIDRHLIEVFHQVYRRDRPQQHRQGLRQKCPDPTTAQLQEMAQLLRDRQVLISSASSVISQLKSIASMLRQEEIWGRSGFPVTEPLEVTDPTTGETTVKEIPDETYSNNLETENQLELQNFCQEQLLCCLDEAIQSGISEHVRQLEQRPRYAHLAHQVEPALRLLYFEKQSQAQIAASLVQASRSD